MEAKPATLRIRNTPAAPVICGQLKSPVSDCTSECRQFFWSSYDVDYAAFCRAESSSRQAGGREIIMRALRFISCMTSGLRVSVTGQRLRYGGLGWTGEGLPGHSQLQPDVADRGPAVGHLREDSRSHDGRLIPCHSRVPFWNSCQIQSASADRRRLSGIGCRVA